MRSGGAFLSLLLCAGGFQSLVTTGFAGDAVERRTDETAPIRALIGRVLPSQAERFECELMPADSGRDAFEYEDGPGHRIVLRGNNGVSLAVAFNQYLRREAALDFDWLASGPLVPATTLPDPSHKVHQVCVTPQRFFLNYCTYGYTFPWWNWSRWERFLDWMAMNGINRPLLQAGQEAVWLRVWQHYGMTADDIRAYFSGPAHLPWHRMANLDKWGGPLPLSYIEQQESLQKQLVNRARELGMAPILSAFAGHVPAQLATLRPLARITPIKPGWSGMAPEYATYYLDPRDPLFADIQARFLREQQALYGTDHLYAADPFNEMSPPSWEPAYLAAVADSIYRGMMSADPEACWYQMTWTFTYEKLGRLWTPERLSTMLHAVPQGKMVLLDYFGEEQELYRATEKCYGLPFIWNYLGNFGGNTHLSAPLEKSARREALALAVPNCVGVGSTLEALGVNPVIYQQVLEQPWEPDGKLDVSRWITRYAARRGAAQDPAVETAWQKLAATVLVDNARRTGTNGSIFQAMPKLSSWHGRSQDVRTDYRPEDLVRALDILFQAAPAARAADGYRFDVVNFTRQVLCNVGVDVAGRMQAALKEKDPVRFRREAATFLELGRDLDDLLGTRREFLLGTWLVDARSWGRSPAESDYYEEDARQIITAWHRPGGELTDYASRQWNGLLRAYYLPRWEKWVQLSAESLEHGTPFPEESYVAWVNDACERWIRTHGDSYLATPRGDPVETVERLFRKYASRR